MDTSTPATTRREFAKQAALAAAVPLLAGLPGCGPAAPVETSPTPAAPTPEAVPAPPIASAPVRPPNPTADALMQVLRGKYGERLTADQWDEVRRGVEGNLQAARALHDFALPITTEPSFGFRAYRGGWR
jgi:hypothetical protein